MLVLEERLLCGSKSYRCCFGESFGGESPEVSAQYDVDARNGRFFRQGSSKQRQVSR